MSEESNWELIITADRDSTVLSRVGNVLTTFTAIPIELRFSEVGSKDWVLISIQLAMPAGRLDLLRRQLPRMTIVQEVTVRVD